MLPARLQHSDFVERAALIAAGSLLCIFILLKTPHLAGYAFGGLSLLALAGFAGTRHPEWLALGFFLSCAIYLENEPGTTPFELFFFAYAILMISVFLLPDFIRGALPLETPVDKLFLGFVLLIPYALTLGLVNGARPAQAFNEVAYYLGFIGYFAYRRYFNRPVFRRALLAGFILLLLFVVIRNALNYREILLEAYLPWQTEKARIAKNEVFLLAGSALFLSFIAYAKNLRYLLLSGVMFAALTGALVITQSRGYWLAFLFAVIVAFGVGERSLKKRVIATGGILLVIAAVIVTLYFQNSFRLVLKALAHRFETIDLANLDASLRERILETQTIVGRIARNPIAGYGFGVTYPRYFILFKVYEPFYYVHNGYLAIWYKFGIVGLGILLAACYYIISYSYQIYVRSRRRVIKALALAVVSTLAGMLLVNITSPQFISFDSMIILALMGLFAGHYYPQLTLPDGDGHADE